ncbi:MAG: transposase family protein [Firmicutes bacterium]|nr:transposase family protein [Bacillota bacterium]
MTEEAAPCPQCGMPSTDKHSTYTRHVADLPWGETTIAVDVVVPKLRCHNAACSQNIFCRRLDPWVPAYGRRSARLTAWIADWAWTTSVEEVAWTAARHGVTCSASTVLRIMRGQPDPVFSLPRIVGIDDEIVPSFVEFR